MLGLHNNLLTQILISKINCLKSGFFFGKTLKFELPNAQHFINLQRLVQMLIKSVNRLRLGQR